MKSYFYAIFIVAFLAATLHAQSHSFNLGARTFKDIHLKREVIFEKSHFLRKASVDYVFEQKDIPNPKILTQVVVTDQYTNGKGGTCTLTSGGPGMTYVKLHFSSKRGHGYNFIIDIYGE